MKYLKFILPILFLVTSLFATTPPVTFYTDVNKPTAWEITLYVGNTPTITVGILTNGGSYTDLGVGWSCFLNYGKNDSASSLKTITGTVAATTGILTFNCLTNSFPASGDFFGEVYLENGSTKITSGQGLLRVKRSPSSGSYGDLNLSPRINWDLVVNQGSVPWSDFSTNYLGSLISANLASANATSAVFQAKFNAQANTNAGFQALHTAQAATNLLKVDVTTFNATNLLKTDLATFNASGVVWQTQITANQTNQAATNSWFQTLLNNLASTNSLFQGLFTAQISTNSLFQSLLDALANTNSLFQGLFTAQVNTNTALQNQITANYTNQNATNIALKAQTDYGVTAYGWGNHALAGYLSASTNLFQSITVADRSALGVNLSGLTQDTYTGSLTSVSYTGVTVMVAGKTYAYGYSKIGASGTSTLSIAGFTLGPHTAVGNYSNHFTFEDTGSNLVLKLDGTGLAQCNASNLYVMAITGGNINVAGNVNIGGTLRMNGAIATNPTVHIALTTNAHGGIVGTNDPIYLAALTNATITGGTSLIVSVTGRILEITVRTNFVENNTGNWVGTWQGLGTNAFVQTNDTRIPTWNTAATDASTATNWLGTNTLQAQITANTTGKVDKVDTNGWTVTAHQAWLTNEALWEAASNSVVYTNNPTLTNARAPTAHEHTYVDITNAPWLTTDTGATNIQAGDADSYDAGTRTLTWNTNAAGGGGGAGTITNLKSTDSSVDIADSGGPEPDFSITNYVAGVVSDYVPTNDTSYLAIETNRIALHGESNVVMRVDGTNVYFGAPGTILNTDETYTDTVAKASAAYPASNPANFLTNEAALIAFSNVNQSKITAAITATPFGVTSTDAYRGDWGEAASNQAYSASTNVAAARVIATNAQAVADAALPKSGGTMSGPLDMGGQAVTNVSDVKNMANVSMVVPIGTIQMYGGAASPPGWLLCNGASVETNSYPALYAVISTNFGSTNAAWFNVPDMRGIFAKGAGTTTRAEGKNATNGYYTAILGQYLQDKFQGHAHAIVQNIWVDAVGQNHYTDGGSVAINQSLPPIGSPTTDNINGTPRTGTSTEPQSLGLTFIIFAGK